MTSNPSFRHDRDGTPEAHWRQADPGRRNRGLSLRELDHLVVVAAHPDDETLGAGGLIAAAASSGIDIDVVVLTDGEASHPRSVTHDADQIAALRRMEAVQAMTTLAPQARLHLMSMPDGRLPDRADELVEVIVGVACRGASGQSSGSSASTWVVAPWRGDRHPDHEAAGTAGRLAADRLGAHLLEYPIWLWHWGTPATAPADDTLHRLELDWPVQATKADAVRCYRSQSEPLSEQAGDEPVVTALFLEHFARPYEIFVAASEREVQATPPDYFTSIYAAADDPWEFASRWYEQRKRQVLMSSLPRRRFRAAFEPGCATGQLTALLAPRCDRLMAIDVVEHAVRQAAARLSNSPHAEVTNASVMDAWPSDEFDLIVFSEVCYYFPPGAIREIAARAVGHLAPDGLIVLCHWRHPAPDHAVAGDDAHAVFRAASGLPVLVEHVEADFRLEILAPRSVPTPAVAEGLA